MKTRSFFGFITALVLLLAACQEFEEYPPEPEISYAGFQILKNNRGGDSLGYLRINYTDGDGDIGLTDSDTLPPYKYNYFLDIYELIKDSLIKIEFDTNVNFNGRIPVLTPEGPHKAIKGEIEMKLELYNMIPFLESDTISFGIYIMDRALHKSNRVETPLYLLN